MKANELMLGDWVYIEDGDAESGLAPVQVVYIDKYNTEWLYPIPLTEEILKANGFLQAIEEGTYYFPQDDINHLGYAIETDDGVAFYITGHELIVFDYVHELQQVLRLCGLEELADNFKLE